MSNLRKNHRCPICEEIQVSRGQFVQCKEIHRLICGNCMIQINNYKLLKNKQEAKEHVNEIKSIGLKGK